MGQPTRVVAGTPLPIYLQRLGTKLIAGNEVEAWTRDQWCCPFCGVETFARPQVDPAPFTCHACKGLYYCRFVEGDTFVTSADDPTKRPGGA